MCCLSFSLNLQRVQDQIPPFAGGILLQSQTRLDMGPMPPTTTHHHHHHLYSTCTPWLNPDFKCHSQNGRKPWKVIIWHPVFLSCITTFYLKDILRNKYFFKCCLIYGLLLYLYTQAFLGCLTFLLFFFFVLFLIYG